MVSSNRTGGAGGIQYDGYTKFIKKSIIKRIKAPARTGARANGMPEGQGFSDANILSLGFPKINRRPYGK